MSGFLAGAQHACGIDFREANEFVGTSAGSIVAAHLANGIEPRVPQQSDALAQSDVTDRDIPMAGIDRAFREWVTALYPITRRATAASGTVGALARAALLDRSAGRRAINGGTQERVRRNAGITFRPTLADCRGRPADGAARSVRGASRRARRGARRRHFSVVRPTRLLRSGTDRGAPICRRRRVERHQYRCGHCPSRRPHSVPHTDRRPDVEPVAGSTCRRQGMGACHHARGRRRPPSRRDGHDRRARCAFRPRARRKPDGHTTPGKCSRARF